MHTSKMRDGSPCGFSRLTEPCHVNFHSSYLKMRRVSRMDKSRPVQEC